MENVFNLHEGADTFVFVSHATTIMIFVRELLGFPMSMDTAESTINIPNNLTTIMVR